MYESFEDYASRIAECEQKANSARNEDARQSWRAMADSWRHTAKLRQLLERQERHVHKVVTRAIDRSFICAP